MVRIESLVINITDICDMSCLFCLRGDGEGRKMDLSLISRIFEGIDVAECVTITGGEPGCYVETVTAITDYLEEHKDSIQVNGLFIVTNGKVYHQELVDAVKTAERLYMERSYGSGATVSMDNVAGYEYVVEEESYMFCVAVSMDKFHEAIPAENWLRYRKSGVYSACKQFDHSKGGIIARGRGEGLPGSVYREYRELQVGEDGDDINAEEVYVTVDGLVFGDCDMSYEMEEYNEPAGDITEKPLAEILHDYAKKKRHLTGRYF